MAGFVDLHVHSTASDGTCSPTENVRLAVNAGLSAYAVTDHDVTEGYFEAVEALNVLKKEDPAIELDIIPGVEISTGYKGNDIHILGLLIDPSSEKLCTELERSRNTRDERNFRMIENFRKLGIDITIEELQAGEPDTVITRAHFARVLINRGYVKDSQEAFGTYLKPEASKSVYVQRVLPAPSMAVRWIREAGGVPVMAHPLLNKLSHDELLELIEKELIPAGLLGLEVMHSTNSAADTDTLRAIADHFGLIYSGGSDFHGANKPDIQIGVGRGELKVPYSYLDKMKSLVKGDKL